MKRRKIAAILLCGLLISLLSGCGSSMQLAQRDIVDAITIDYSDEGFTVCIAAFNISKEEEANGYKVYTEEAETLNDAFLALMNNTLSALMFENNTVVFIGADAYKYRYAMVMDYLAHSYRGDMNTQIIGTASNARTALEKIVAQKGSFSQLVANLSDPKLQRRACSNQLYQCAPDKNGKIRSAFLPVVTFKDYQQPDSEQTRTEMTLTSLAVYNDSGWIEDLTGELMEGVLILQNRTHRIPLQIEVNGNTVDASLQEPTVKLVRNDQDASALIVQCTVDFVLPNAVAGMSDGTIRAIKTQNEQYLTSLLAQATYHCRALYGIDLLNLGSYTYLLAEKPQGLYPDLTFKADIR